MGIGWQCPACKACYSPAVPSCFYCTPRGGVVQRAPNDDAIIFGHIEAAHKIAQDRLRARRAVAKRTPLRDGRVLVERVQCPACRGQGAIRGPQQGMPWFECKYCKGTGAVTEREANDWPDQG